MALSLSEARNIISESPFVDALNELNFTVSYPFLRLQFEFKGLYNIYKYFYEQFVGWEKVKTTVPSYLVNNSYPYFKNALSALQGFIKGDIKNDTISESSVISAFNRNIAPKIKVPTNSTPFPFDAAEVDFLTELNLRNENTSRASYNYLIGNIPTLNTIGNVEGVLMAYEFRNKENSTIFNRRLKEKPSLDRLKSKLETLSVEYENDITKFTAKLKEDFKAHTSDLEEFKKSKEKSVTDWFVSEKGTVESFRKEAKQDIDNIQASYRSKLELEEPITYWTARAEQLNKKANRLLSSIIAISLLFASGVYFLLWHTPADLLQNVFGGDREAAIRWSLVFIIFTSIFFVVIRALLKFMFSNYHLARDAEEREKLTFLYLSMIDKGAIDEEERKIILQSLFSRSDTGLLKEDSSPTMPNIGNLITRS